MTLNAIMLCALFHFGQHIIGSCDRALMIGDVPPMARSHIDDGRCDRLIVGDGFWAVWG
jgi:hypothetical protein